MVELRLATISFSIVLSTKTKRPNFLDIFSISRQLQKPFCSANTLWTMTQIYLYPHSYKTIFHKQVVLNIYRQTCTNLQVLHFLHILYANFILHLAYFLYFYLYKNNFDVIIFLSIAFFFSQIP